MEESQTINPKAIQALFLEELEQYKETLFREIRDGNRSRTLLNAFWRVISEIDYRKRMGEPTILELESVAESA